MIKTAKMLAWTALPQLLAAPCVSSLALATTGVGVLVAAYLFAALASTRAANADREYLARVELLAAYAEPIDYPDAF